MNTQHKMNRDRTTEIKTPVGTGKMGNTQLSSIYQNYRVLLERNCGSSDPAVTVSPLVSPSGSCGFSSWEDLFCPSSPTATSEAGTGEDTFSEPPHLSHSASCRYRFIDLGVGLICHRFWQAGFLASLAIQFLYNYKNAFQAICFCSVPCVSNHS